MAKKSICYLLFASLFMLISCKSPKEESPKTNIANSYIQAVQSNNFTEIRKLLHDSILYVDSDFIVANSIESYYIFFQWDSTFNPVYKTLDTNVLNDSVTEYTITKTCQRIQFLHDTPTKYKLEIQTKNNKIVKLNIKENIVFDFAKWQKRRDSLTTFIQQNHPDLDGFVFDITAKGARNYLKAIELYNKEKN